MSDASVSDEQVFKVVELPKWLEVVDRAAPRHSNLDNPRTRFYVVNPYLEASDAQVIADALRDREDLESAIETHSELFGPVLISAVLAFVLDVSLRGPLWLAAPLALCVVGYHYYVERLTAEARRPWDVTSVQQHMSVAGLLEIPSYEYHLAVRRSRAGAKRAVEVHQTMWRAHALAEHAKAVATEYDDLIGNLDPAAAHTDDVRALHQKVAELTAAAEEARVDLTDLLTDVRSRARVTTAEDAHDLAASIDEVMSNVDAPMPPPLPSDPSETV